METCETCILIPEMTPVVLEKWSNPDVCAGSTSCPMCHHVFSLYYCPFIPIDFIQLNVNVSSNGVSFSAV